MCKNNVKFIPSKELIDLQKVELDLLKEFIRVCNKYNIKYFAEGGTLLGAVRHNGFIPWDDDIDLQMTWDNYQKFQAVAPKEFSNPYVFQDYSTDTYYDVTPMARIRNSNTTGCTKWELDNVNDCSYNRGVFIDIWCLFPVPDDEFDKVEQKEHIILLWKAIRGWYAQQNIKIGKPTAYAQYLPFWEEVEGKYSIKDLKCMYLDVCNSFANKETEYYGMTSFRTFNPHFMWKREWFDESVNLPFEDIEIACPQKYNEILTQSYGDWKVPVYDGSIHEMAICDPNTPYSELDIFRLNA